MSQIMNLTPHEVKIVDENGALVKAYPASGNTIRLQQETVEIGLVDGVRLTATRYGAPVLVTPEGEETLPPEVEGSFYIVSAMAKAALSERTDMLVPAEQVRDDQGRVIGCKSFGK